MNNYGHSKCDRVTCCVEIRELTVIHFCHQDGMNLVQHLRQFFFCSTSKRKPKAAHSQALHSLDYWLGPTLLPDDY